MYYLNIKKTTLEDFNKKVNRALLTLFLMYIVKALVAVVFIGYLVKTELFVWGQSELLGAKAPELPRK